MTLGPLMIDIAGTALTAAEIERLGDPRIGGVILFSRNYESVQQLRRLTAEIHGVRQPGLLVAVDQEGGRVQRFRTGFTALPPARWIGHQYDIDEARGCSLARICGWLMAAELREAGVDFCFAPVADLDWGLSEVIGDRAFHADPEAVIALALAWMQGMRRAGMTAVAKHFPGHGAVRPDSHVELPEDHRVHDQIMEDMRPYAALIDAGLQGVMIAHVRYPLVDRRIASLSPYWVQTELRGGLGFGGAIFSDDLQMAALREIGPMPERVRRALGAGADMALICNNIDGVDETLDAIADYDNPAAHGRLVAMRPAAVGAQAGALRDSDEWRQATAELRAAERKPPLELNG